MEIFNNNKMCFGGMIVGAGFGGFGAYLIRPILNPISPLGVALATGITSGIAYKIIFTENNFLIKFIGLIAAYPLGIFFANFARRVHFLEPAVSVVVSSIILTVLIATAFFFAVISKVIKY